MRRRKIDAATLARAVKVAEAEIEAWRDGRDLIPPAIARQLAAHLRITTADILLGLSYDPNEPDPIIDIE